MIIVETLPNHPGLIKRYSDSGKLLLQQPTGAIYEEAIDVENAPYTYTEIDNPNAKEEITDTEALDIILGRDSNESE